jgi:hypothetical protein
MELNMVLETYFRGERQLGLSFVYTGVALLGVAYWAWRSVDGSFGAALTATALVVALALGGAGSWFEHKNEAQERALVEAAGKDPRAVVDAELARMAGVNNNWSKARLMWLVSGLLGALLLNFVRKDAAGAVGLALVFLTAVLFVVDELGERRAAVYTAALQAARSAP